jgi:mono/diheme cytochrome c family protein
VSLPVVWWVVLLLALVQFALWKRRAGTFVWTLATWASIFLFVKFGFTTPVPQSVVMLYMAIATGAVAAYVTSSPDRLREFGAPLVRLATEPRQKPLLLGVMLAIPALVAFGVWRQMSVEIQAPAFGRTIHPAPPDSIAIHGKNFDLVTLDSPFRALQQSDPAKFREHAANGRRIYFQNCFYCHGDAMRGDGMYARGLNPIPTNFADGGAIALLQESFIFWRVAKGGPGLPEESGPWDTAMPAWEKFLTEEEMWDVALFLYEFTGQQPRAREEVHH